MRCSCRGHRGQDGYPAPLLKANNGLIAVCAIALVGCRRVSLQHSLPNAIPTEILDKAMWPARCACHGHNSSTVASTTHLFFAPVTDEGLAPKLRNRRSGSPKNNPWPSERCSFNPGRAPPIACYLVAVHSTVLSSSLLPFIVD
jgi:hypothetical protein